MATLRESDLSKKVDEQIAKLQVYLNATKKGETPLMNPEIDQCALESRNDDVRVEPIDYESDEESFDDFDNIIIDSPPPPESTLVLPSTSTSSPTDPILESNDTREEPIAPSVLDKEPLESCLDYMDWDTFDAEAWVGVLETIDLMEDPHMLEGDFENVNSYTLIDFEGALTRVQESHMCLSEMDSDPLKGDFDFVIPCYCPKGDPRLLFYVAQFPRFLCKLKWKYKGKKRNRNWLGDFPFWEEFGSIEFMPVNTAMDFLLFSIRSSLNVLMFRVV